MVWGRFWDGFGKVLGRFWAGLGSNLKGFGAECWEKLGWATCASNLIRLGLDEAGWGLLLLALVLVVLLLLLLLCCC